MEEKIFELIEGAKKTISLGLLDTNYTDKSDPILSHYIAFLKVGIEVGLITESNIELYKIDRVVFNEKSNAYADWCFNILTLAPRFFLERSEQEQRNVIFHELIHSVMDILIKSNKFSQNFKNFCYHTNQVEGYVTSEKIQKYNSIIELGNYYQNNPFSLIGDSITFFNEVTTQSLAEILTAKSYGQSRGEYKKFDSKILTNESILKSNFATYQEYQQPFHYFLRTVNGLGAIENDDDLFIEYFKLLYNGTIWQQIIGTYTEKNNLQDLFEFLSMLAILLKTKESSMGINVVYGGNKDELTKLINYICVKMNEMRDVSETKQYPFIEYMPIPTKRVSLSF